MPDIFLSYSRTDLAVASQMAAALQAAGHDVWWDQALKAGEVYDRVTEAALREARVVVVLWSKASVQSDWVRSEATVAMQRGALMPVMIEDCQRPVMFELRQSADLIGWKGNAKDPRLVAFVADVTRQLGTPVPAATNFPAPTGPNRRLLIGGAVGVAALAAGGFGAWQAFGGRQDDGTASLVVLPFANLSGDVRQAYFSDGIAEELRNALAQIRGLKVIGRVSSEKFRDTGDLAAAAAELGVDHVLTGSVRRSARTIRISAQLVEARSGVESWSQSYDQPAADALEVQSRIATSVVAALSARLGEAAGRITVGGTNNPEAQALFLQAEQIGRAGQSRAIMERQRALLDAATRLDPDYAEAWALKAGVTSYSRSFVTSAADVAQLLDAAMADSRRAVALAPRSGYVRMSLSFRYRSLLNMRQAFIEAEKALNLAPADSRVVSGVGGTLRLFDPDRAVLTTQRGLTLDPLNPLFLDAHCLALLAANRHQEAADAAGQLMAVSANQYGASALVEALFGLGRYAQAKANLSYIVLDNIRISQAAIIEARAGTRAASDAALAAVRKIADGSANFTIAGIHAQRRENPLALDAIEASLQYKEISLIQLAVSTFLDPIRSEPRFKAVQDAVIPADLFVPPSQG